MSKSSTIIIGKSEGKNLKLDIELLITSRLLIQANSGGGKSWLLRRLAEQFYGKVQTIIIDPEGEFFTLREKFGYVLVGDGGETPADVRSAAMLAEKFLQLKANAVCDLYEAFRSRPMERRLWVATFLNALIDAPRSLWHPLLVIVDEAHKFCPQETPKAGNQRDREIIGSCKESMIALSTTGRKRGFCPIWATQRLAKLDKDASAEFFNRLVGMTIEDVDVKRAADLMSVSKDETREFHNSLRQLNPGEFYAFGRAITKERKLVTVGEVQTHHPETGAAAKNSEPPPTPQAIKGFLPQLADLPAEAEQKAKTEKEMKAEISRLRAQVVQLGKQKQPAASAPVPAKVRRDEKREQQIAERAAKAARAPLLKRLHELKRAAKPILNAIAGLQSLADADLPAEEAPAIAPPAPTRPAAAPRPAASIIQRPAPLPSPDETSGDPGDLQQGERAILLAAAQCHPADREQLSIITGYKKSTRNKYIQFLQSKGLVEDKNEKILPTPEGMAALGPDYKPLPTGSALQEYWLGRLPNGEKVILSFVLRSGGEPVDREAISEATGYKKSTRNRYIQFLQARHLLEAGAGSEVKPASMLFDGANGEAA